MKIFKKIGAWFMALVFVTFMISSNVFAAADTATPNPEPTGKVTINNIESGATVTAYKMSKGTYTNGKLTGFESLTFSNGKKVVVNPTSPTEKEVIAAANKYDELGTGIALKSDGTTYTADLTPGSYVVLVTDTVDKVYNPILVSVGYDENAKIVGGTVDAAGNFTLGDTTYYAKSTEITVEKTMKDQKKLEEAQIGTVIPFTIKTTIPSYSNKYDTNSLKFNISDTISAGFTYEKDLTVKVGGEQIPSSNDTYSVDYANGDKSFTITFAPSFIKANGTKEVVVSYNAKLTETAAVNFDPNTNKANIEYTNNKGVVTDGTPVTDKVYTFEINGELYKTDANNAQTKLAGAVFEFTNTSDENAAVITSTASDAAGKIVAKGLDSDVVYKVTEVTPPTGYSLNDEPFYVKITKLQWSNEDSTVLIGYDVEISKDQDFTNKTTISHTNGATTDFKDAVNIPNTKMSSLPSTGGMGTYLFTFGGITLMAAAAVMFTLNRKNKEKVTK